MTLPVNQDDNIRKNETLSVTVIFENLVDVEIDKFKDIRVGFGEILSDKPG